MWEKLPPEEKTEYKKMMLAFASLTEMFNQKNEETEAIVPVLNSKYQEKVFHKVFNAVVEDIGNTSYDASINGDHKYLVGLKTFNMKSGEQKIAQFKANHNEWTDDFNLINRNAHNSDGSLKSKEEINEINRDIYLRIAKRIAELRNMRIRSSRENLRGFDISKYDEGAIESVYHVLMPANEDNSPFIAVGEMSYDLIDIDNIEIKGCSNARTPGNFTFTDKNHEYRFTVADSQLLMNFRNKQIIVDTWPVKYADDAYEIFAGLADRLYKEPKEESYSWLITNDEGAVELYSGFNSFFGVGSKISLENRKKKIDKFVDDYASVLNGNTSYFADQMEVFFMDKEVEKAKKVEIRNGLMEKAGETANEEMEKSLSKLLFRPADEVYIPLPNARRFHEEHPDFFVKGGIKFDGSHLVQTPEERKFRLVFEPSKDAIDAFIAEDSGKAIESSKSMKILGEWIRHKVFQLEEYEPLTVAKLNEVGINGIRLVKVEGSDDIHLHFIWIDKDNLPEDYWK